MKMIDAIRAGDRVTIMDRFGVPHTGSAVMPCIAGGWVLNMGGKHGIPGIASEANVTKVSGSRRPAKGR